MASQYHSKAHYSAEVAGQGTQRYPNPCYPNGVGILGPNGPADLGRTGPLRSTGRCAVALGRASRAPPSISLHTDAHLAFGRAERGFRPRILKPG